jgi:hypothetical protein
MPEQYTITGTIIPPEGVHRADIKVQAFDRDLPSLERRRDLSSLENRTGLALQQLGNDGKTDDGGRFEIPYTLEQFQAGEGVPLFRRMRTKNADLSFRVFDRSGQELSIEHIEAMDRGFGPDQIIFNAPPKLEVSIVVESPRQVGDSDYEQLLALIAPIIEGVPLTELTNEDVSFLLNELGVEQHLETQQKIEWLRRSALLAQETNLPTEAFYGWGRMDLPLPFHGLIAVLPEELAQIAERLFGTDRESRRDALLKALDARIIPDAWRDRLDELDRQLSMSRPIQRHGMGKLIDADSGTPLRNYRVEMFDPSGRGVHLEPVSVVTDSRGLFPVLFSSSVSMDALAPRSLRLKVLKDEPEPIFETEIRIEAGEPPVIELQINLPISPEPEAHDLSQLVRVIDLEIPEDLLSFLASAGLKTLRDIRQKGGISQLQGLPIATDHPVVHRLEAHADLSRVSPDTRSNEFLIDKGYSSGRAIAESTRACFVQDVHSKLGDFNAAKLHAVAGAQMYFLDNVITGLMADQTNSYAHVENILTDDVTLPQRCSCRDCETAVSPLAYLIDLATYTLQHVTNNGVSITLQTLTDTFHQPFAELAVSCESVDARVRQVRLCVEVLRAFLGPRPLDDDGKEAALSAAEQVYRLAAYQVLLSHIGTSYAELRLAQDADSTTRQSLADRLQIEVGRLSRLYLDPANVDPANPATLTESRLEQLFGLIDTNRDPLAPPAPPEFQAWRLEYLRTLWREQDFTDDLYDDGRAIAALKKVPAGVVFAPPALAAKIAHDTESQQLTFKGAMSFEERETLLGLSVDADFLRAIKQLYHASKRFPVIDPDLIGPDDLREPIPGNKAFDLWKTRRKWVDDRLSALAALTVDDNGEQVPDLDAMLAAMYEPVAYGAINVAAWVSAIPVGDFEKLSEELESENFEVAKFRIEDELNLSVESFEYLMRIRAKNKVWLADRRNEKVSIEEWQDLRSILVQAHKRRHFLNWRDEEHTAGLMFDPKTFWISLTEPSEGAWPPAESAGIPLIDPATLKLKDLPDPIAGERAIAFWQARQFRLKQISQELAAEHEANGFDAMLKLALGDPLPHDLDILKRELSNPEKVVSATEKITDDFHLTVEDFKKLLVIKAKNEGDPEKRPSAAEWVELYAILTTPLKIKQEFPVWVQEEQHPDTGVLYWSALKAKLPPWRSSLESRSGWQTALHARSRPPVVDPDLIVIGDLHNPVSGNRAFDLYESRQKEIVGRLAELQAEPKTHAGFDACLQKIVGLSWAQFLTIANQHEQGHTVDKRLVQLNLDFRRFNYLLRIGRLAAAGETILDAEWQDVYDILIQVWKERNFAAWLGKEKADNVLLGLDLFQILPVEDTSSFSASVNLWRFSRAARQQWEETLQTRIDQEAVVVAALQSAVDAAEEYTLPTLRDALLASSSAPATSTDPNVRFEQQAKWITENLLIDAKMSGCMMTTRVAQAIEVIQGLIHSLRTGQPQDLFQTWVFDLTNFEEEWKWMGSYPSWRGAMFVWMYPELLAQPDLRRTKTPGFEALLKETRENRNFMPNDACREAKRYSEYFQDVCTLRVQVTCLARTRLSKTAGCNKSVSDERCFFYMFGLGGLTGTVYWSRYDFQDSSGYAQSFWEPVVSKVPDFKNIVELLGAVPFRVSSGDRYIFLLARRKENNIASLVCAKYDLDNDRWHQEKMLTLNTPMGSGDFKAVVCQSDSESEAPHILFYGKVNDGANTLYREQRFNAEGSDWEEKDIFRPLYLGWDWGASDDPKAPRDIPEKYIPVGIVRHQKNAFVIFVQRPGYVFAYKCYPNPNKNQFNRYLATQGALFNESGSPGNYRGAYSWKDVDGIFLFIASSIWSGTSGGLPNPFQPLGLERDKILFLEDSVSPSPGTKNVLVVSKTMDSPFPPDEGGGPLFFPLHQTRRSLLPSWGITDDTVGKTKRFVYCSPWRTEHHQPLLFRDQFGPSHFLASPSLPVIPNILGPFDISTELSDDNLIARHGVETEAFKTIESYSASSLTYLQEAYYSVPVTLALALQRSGEYVAALDWFRTVYADGLDLALRKIYPGLRTEESLPNTYNRAKDWLLDPLDPHRIAATRANAYTRYTILAIVRCLLDYADAEFTHDTAESNSTARRLYLRALELLEAPELKQRLMDQCEEVIGTLEEFPDEQWHSSMRVLKHELRSIANLALLTKTVPMVNTILQSNESPATRFEKARILVTEARTQLPKAPTLKEVIQERARIRDVIQKSTAANRHVANALDAVGALAAEDFQRSVSVVTGLSPVQLIKKSSRLNWLREPFQLDTSARSGAQDLILKTRQDGVVIDPLFQTYQGTLAQVAESQPQTAFNIIKKNYNGFVPSPILGFCVPRNPMLSNLKTRAEINLHKLRTCRNISGLKRILEPYAAPTDARTGLPQISNGGQIVLPGVRAFAPTLYRYSTLIDRAKQLVQLAAQMEATLHAAILRRDQAAFRLFEVGQKLELADAAIRLQDLRVVESQGKVTLAELAKTRAQFQADHFGKLIDEGKDGLSENEREALRLLEDAVEFLDTADDLQVIAAGLYFSDVVIRAAGGFIAGLTGGTAAGPVGQTSGSFAQAVAEASKAVLGSTSTVASGLSALAGGFSTRAQIRSTRSSIRAMRASFERRLQEWQFQRDLANQDVTIADQQIRIADDEVNVVKQERVIAGIQQTQARDVIEYLTTKQFDTVELNEWMSDVLQGVYRYFLQQATAIARLAENQLAFERQEIPPAYIHSDYWIATDDSSVSTGNSSVDRRGLTGSARLLQDIYQLDQYAFDKKKRKLQISKTISLAMLAPIEFQRFRESGVITFATPMELFDRDFPGHYLRLISKVSVSVVALIPPSQGIHAMLTSSGLSRVVIGPDIFQQVPIRRDPEFIALSSPMNSTGIFELEPQMEMLRPFEGTGVDTIWEFRMPKAANQFDYRTIANLLLTIDYTALSSNDYRQQVIQSLPSTLQAEASFSFRSQFADQWYDFHNPDLTKTPMKVRFQTFRQDFPPNLEAIKIQQVLLYFVRANQKTFELPITELRFTEEGNQGTVGGSATPIDGIISTRRGNGGSWTAMIGKSPSGEWGLTLPDTEEMKNRFKNEEIEDILLVITYSGRTPEWPI